jgi:hypothetical protein
VTGGTSAGAEIEGKAAKAGFTHTVAAPGSPENGDPTTHTWSGELPAGKVGQISPELHLALFLKSTPADVSVVDERYYWNYVRSDDNWAWRLAGSGKTGGFNVGDAFKGSTEKKRGVYVGKDSKGKEFKGFVTLKDGTLTLWGLFHTGDGKVGFKIAYKKAAPGAALTQNQRVISTKSAPAKSGTTALPLTPSMNKPDEIAKALQSVGIEFKLQTVPGGSGAPSHFGSGRDGESSTSTAYLEEEQNKLASIVAILTDPEVQALIRSRKIAKILVRNPYIYDSSESFAYVSQIPAYTEEEKILGYSEDAALTLSLSIDKERVLAALQEFSLREPVIPGLSVKSESQD